MFRGSMVAIVTPMLADGAIDKHALHRLVEHHIEQGTDAIVVNGTTGESATLSLDEQFNMIADVVDYVDKRIPVIAGTGTNSTTVSINTTLEAMHLGVNACLLVTPYYNRPTQEGLYLHYKAIAEAAPIPLILYNVPGRTGVDLDPATVARLSSISNIIGIKEAYGKKERYRALIEQCQDKLDVYSGDDSSAIDALLLGAKGVISVTANVAPKLMHQMCVAALTKDYDKAIKINQQLSDLHDALVVETNPIPCKWALNLLGFINEGIRLPLTPLAEQYHETVYAALTKANLVPGHL